MVCSLDICAACTGESRGCGRALAGRRGLQVLARRSTMFACLYSRECRWCVVPGCLAACTHVRSVTYCPIWDPAALRASRHVAVSRHTHLSSRSASPVPSEITHASIRVIACFPSPSPSCVRQSPIPSPFTLFSSVPLPPFPCLPLRSSVCRLLTPR
ncbi:hypothetical protein B0H10DRAFT_677664 [Mycena sp. CBHHK59/15]|nr:hypothetical protein B0H10DRAFT_677664 [Mycena sp. CBHHK59/15]